MKKTLLSISVALCLFSNNANASGIPVVDTASISQSMIDNLQQYTQMLQDYTQQALMYKQMITDTLNFEKHLEALGVNMNDWAQIIGEVADTISGIENLYTDLKNIPDDFVKQFQRANNACTFLQGNVDEFGQIANSLRDYKRTITKCYHTIQNHDIISAKINSLEKDLKKATNLDEINSIKNQIENIKNAEAFVKQEKNQETANKILAVNDEFYGEDGSGEKKLKIKNYQERGKELAKLAKQMKEARNEKQVQAVTNSILLSMLELQTEMQGIMINFSTALATQQGAWGNKEKLNEDSYKKEIVKNEFSDDLYKDVKKMNTDEHGLPVFSIN